MSLSPVVEKWAVVYEQEHGLRPGERVLQIVEHILTVGKMLTKRGEEDAQQGKSTYPSAVFPALVVKAFGMDISKHPDTVQAVAELWQSDYMDGYNEGKDGGEV